MPGPDVATVSAAYLIHSSQDLWLPWQGVVRVLLANHWESVQLEGSCATTKLS